MSVSPTDQHAPRRWLTQGDCRLDDFIAIVEQRAALADYPYAANIVDGVLIYDSAALVQASSDSSTRRAIQAELAAALLDGPGIVVCEGAFEPSVVDRVSIAFERMIASQHASGVSSGDHFAKPGANDRVWNALEKLALSDPEAFVDYYANDLLALVATAWLGPGYQVTSQVNVVNPGGDAQSPHCDYHLGFQSNEVAEQYPAHVHDMSPRLTLQGAVAHVDMPIESGPTLYLPHSQKFEAAYLAWRNNEFKRYFDEHHVQLPLVKGDAVFFNPALFHAAGHNQTSHIRRMANLLQVSSAFGRAMETVDRVAMTNAIFPVLLTRQAGGFSASALANVIASSAEAYPFPTNLDFDRPVDGLAPESQASMVSRALKSNMLPTAVAEQLAASAARQLGNG